MESSEQTYQIDSTENKLLWRNTLSDSIVKFKSVKPMIKEKTADDMKKAEKGGSKDKYELSEANIIKNLKIGDKLVHSNKLYYYPETKKWYNVVNVKKEDDVIVSVTMNEHNTSEKNSDTETITLSGKDADTLRDYVYVNIRFHSEGVTEDTVNTKVRLQAKLEDELQAPILGATGKGLTMFKFFFNSKLIDKESMISKLDNVTDDMYLYACVGYSKAYTFKRFHKPYEWPYWGYYGTTIDAIAFVPSQNVVLCGWAIYATDRDSFELKYKIYVDDTVVEDEDTPVVWSEFEDKFYFRMKTKKLHEIKAGSKLELTLQIAKTFSTNEYVSWYYGERGDDWATVENEHMGLWTVEYSSKSGSSSVGYGNFPEIMYYV